MPTPLEIGWRQLIPHVRAPGPKADKAAARNRLIVVVLLPYPQAGDDPDLTDGEPAEICAA
jgi:hypothetical protein